MSKAFPAILVLGARTGPRRRPARPRARSSARAAILQARQNADGAFGLWNADDATDPFLTAYATHFLLEARARGHAVPESTLRARARLPRRRRSSPPRSCRRSARGPTALYLLTRNGAGEDEGGARAPRRARRAAGRPWQGDLAALLPRGDVPAAEPRRRGAKAPRPASRSTRDVEARLPRTTTTRSPSAASSSICSRSTSRRGRATSRAEASARARRRARAVQHALRRRARARRSTRRRSSSPPAVGGGVASPRSAATARAAPARRDGHDCRPRAGSRGRDGVRVTRAARRAALHAARRRPASTATPPADKVANGLEVSRELRDASGKPVTSCRITAKLDVVLFVRSDGRRTRARWRSSTSCPAASRSTSPPTRSPTRRSLGRRRRGVDARATSTCARTASSSTAGSARAAQRFVYRIKPTNRGRFRVPPVLVEGFYDRTAWGRGLGGEIDGRRLMRPRRRLARRASTWPRRSRSPLAARWLAPAPLLVNRAGIVAAGARARRLAAAALARRATSAIAALDAARRDPGRDGRGDAAAGGPLLLPPPRREPGRRSCARRRRRPTSGGDRRVGGSTITMQLARLRFDLDTRTWRGKLAQIAARALARAAFYEARDPRGVSEPRARTARTSRASARRAGCGSGSPPRELTPAEALSLAVVPKSPQARSPSTAAGRARDRGRARAARARVAPRHEPSTSRTSRFRSRDELPFRAPHLADRVARGRAASRAAIETTIDPALQALVERAGRALRRRRAPLRPPERRRAARRPPRRWRSRAYVGSADHGDAAIEGAVDGVRGRRSPGSALKPFLYGLALDAGLINPQTMLEDTSLTHLELEPGELRPRLRRARSARPTRSCGAATCPRSSSRTGCRRRALRPARAAHASAGCAAPTSTASRWRSAASSSGSTSSCALYAMLAERRRRPRPGR